MAGPAIFYQGLEPGGTTLVPRQVAVPEAQRLLDTGEIDESSLVWTTGMGQEWKPLTECLGEPPFADLRVANARPLSQMVQFCNDRWKTSLPQAGPLSFKEDGHHVQWSSSASSEA